MSDYDPILHALEIEQEHRNAMVRQMLCDAGRPDVLAQYDSEMRLLRLGITTARNCWHSISPAQRAALEFMEDGAKLWRDPMNPRRYYIRDKRGAAISVRLATIRVLAAHELLAWDGGAFDPEAKAVLTERGRFVLKHGRQRDGSAP